MLKPGQKLNILLTREHRAKIALDMICEFMDLIEEELYNPEKPNLCTEDYTLRQFQQRVGKKIQHTDKYKHGI